VALQLRRGGGGGLRVGRLRHAGQRPELREHFSTRCFPTQECLADFVAAGQSCLPSGLEQNSEQWEGTAGEQEGQSVVMSPLASRGARTSEAGG